MEEPCLTGDDLCRFNKKIGKTENCWGWLASKNTSGYGHFRVGDKTYSAHRLSFVLYKGPIPKDKFVLHHCDNPPCTNPEHLYLGDKKQNWKDCVDRGRTNRAFGDRNGSRLYPERLVRGPDNHKTKLTEEQVVEIRELFIAGNCSYADLSRRFNVKYPTIKCIITRKTWSHAK